MRKAFQELVEVELERARMLFPRRQASMHEGYAVMLEEVDELWESIRRNAHSASIIAEAVQVAAMAQRLAEDAGLVESAR